MTSFVAPMERLLMKKNPTDYQVEAILANFSKIPKTAFHGSFYGLLNLHLQRKKFLLSYT